MAEPGKVPQVWVEVSGTAVRFRRSTVAPTWPTSCGAADQSRATAPVTCGAEADVPENAEVYRSPGFATRTVTPGAERSGFRRLDPSAVTGPREEKLAIASELD